MKFLLPVDQIEHRIRHGFAGRPRGFGAARRAPPRHRAEIDPVDQRLAQDVRQIAQQKMLERGELALPDDILHFDHQGIADQRGGERVRADFFARGDVPGGAGAGFGIGHLGRKFQFGDETAGAFHGGAGGKHDCSTRQVRRDECKATNLAGRKEGPARQPAPVAELYDAEVPELVLASASPRRRELLTIAGFRFTVRSRPVEERRGAGEPPEQYAMRLAREKAEAAWEQRDEIVLGADTIVTAGGRVLEKPADAAEARAMLRLLSGRTHVVLTGICLRHAGGALADRAVTRVHFTALSDAEIEDYAASGEPLDKAGAYAIQGLASKFIDRIEGDYFNVMGLPLALFYRRWKELQGRRVK